MKKNIKKILLFTLMLSLLVGMMAGFSVFAAEEETPAVEIVSKNVLYADTLKLMYAVRTADEDVVLNIYDANNDLLETIETYNVEDVNGETLKTFTSSRGVPAQNIDTVFYAEAVLADGTKSAKVRYSVLEYLYERLTTTGEKAPNAAQATMYNNLLAFADSADIVMNEATAENSIANYAYVKVTNGTVDGTYASAMLMAGTKLDKLATDYVVESGKVLVWEVNAYEIGKTPAETVLSEADVVEFAVEAGKVYELTPNSVESGEPIITTVSTTVADYATANEWANSTKYATMNLDQNITVKAIGGGNTGKYYTSGSNWRMYQSESAKVEISVPNGKKIVTVKIAYTMYQGGVIVLNGSTVESNKEVMVNASSITFEVADNDSGDAGQARITAIEVVYTDVPAHDCVYSDANCTTPKTCTICGATDGEALGHSYDDGVETTPATCTETGVKTYTCHCGDTKTEDIEALGHTTSNGICDNCKEQIGGSTGATEGTLATFELGANGSASHSDGSSTAVTTYTETNNDYTLNITGGTNMYKAARDAKGNSCLKLGASSKAGSFTFTVDANVTKVIIYVAKYKTNTTKVSINGTDYTVSKASNNGEYDAIEIDTTTTKTITFKTLSGGYRCMVNTIEFIGKV